MTKRTPTFDEKFKELKRLHEQSKGYKGYPNQSSKKKA